MRLIDAYKLYPDCLTKTGRLAISQSQIANAPTVLDRYEEGFEDAKKEFERQTGEWITICTLPVIRKCSLCGVEQSGDAILYGNFCSNCGADMRGVRKNDKGNNRY